MNSWAFLFTNEGLLCPVSTVMLLTQTTCSRTYTPTQTRTHMELQTRNLPCLADRFLEGGGGGVTSYRYDGTTFNAKHLHSQLHANKQIIPKYSRAQVLMCLVESIQHSQSTWFCFRKLGTSQLTRLEKL